MKEGLRSKRFLLCWLLAMGMVAAVAPQSQALAEGTAQLPASVAARSGTEEAGGEVQTLEVRIDEVREVSWEAVIAMGRTWYVDDPPAFLIGSQPGQGDIVTFELSRGYERRQGRFLALPGTYYVTAKAGYGVKNAPGDIREFPVFGEVQGSLF